MPTKTKPQDWEVRLAHAKAVRNAIALCNDVPLNSIIDPPGGMTELVPAQKMKFNGTKVKSYLTNNGHDFSSLDKCKCWRDLKRIP